MSDDKKIEAGRTSVRMAIEKLQQAHGLLSDINPDDYPGHTSQMRLRAAGRCIDSASQLVSEAQNNARGYQGGP